MIQPIDSTRDRLRHGTIASILSSQGDDALIRWYAELVGNRGESELAVIRDNGCADATHAELRRLHEASPLHMLLADWHFDLERLRGLMSCAALLNVPALFIRQSGLEDIRRILLATAGGVHTLELMWIAGEIATTLGLPLQVIRLKRAPPPNTADWLPEYVSAPPDGLQVEHWTSWLIRSESEVLDTPNLVNGIQSCIRNGDLLILGAPGPFHATDQFRSSVPAIIARRTCTPMILLQSRKPDELPLRQLLWGGLISLPLKARTRQATIEELVDSLVLHYQVSASEKPLMVRQAMQREQLSPTAVDCETAFPHIRMPGFIGLACSMGIAPHGINFGAADGSLTRFVFLMVTGDGYCDDYLNTLARIARCLIRPDARRRLLACRTPEAVLNVLEPSTAPLRPSYQDAEGPPSSTAPVPAFLTSPA